MTIIHWRMSPYRVFSVHKYFVQYNPITLCRDLRTVEIQDKKDSNITTPLHGALIIITFVGLMSLGVLILRIINSPKLHAINQTVSAVVSL